MKKVRTWWLPDREEHLVKYIERDDNYQAKLRGHALRFVKDFDIAIDIGAHVGLWTRELCDRFREVIAFEPMPEHALCLYKNVPAQNLSVFECALGDERGTVRIVNVPESSGHSWVVNEKHITEEAQCVSQEVEMRTLDFILASFMTHSMNYKKISFIKLDCEGYELKALRGAEEIIKFHKPVINIEQKFAIDSELGDAGRFLESIGMKLLGQMSDEYVYGF